MHVENENQKNLNSFSAIYGSGKRGDESEFISQYESKIKNMHFSAELESWPIQATTTKQKSEGWV